LKRAAKVGARGALLVCVLSAGLLLHRPGSASAATYSTSCPSGDASCAALAERLEAIETQLETANAALAAPLTVNQGDDFWRIGNPDQPLSVYPSTGSPSGAFGVHVDNSLDVNCYGGDSGEACNHAPTGAASTVALGADDSHRLDLVWWGVWGTIGLLLVLIISAAWFRAWALDSKLGPG
jgi:hypothetical protein